MLFLADIGKKKVVYLQLKSVTKLADSVEYGVYICDSICPEVSIIKYT